MTGGATGSNASTRATGHGKGTSEVPVIRLFRLCAETDENAAEVVAGFIQKHGLVEIEMPPPEDYPPDTDGTKPLPLPQWRKFIADRHGASAKAFIRPGDQRDFGTGAVTVGESRTVLLVRAKGQIFYSDATEFFRGLWSSVKQG